MPADFASDALPDLLPHLPLQDKAALESRCTQLESELRKSKRREEKLQVGERPAGWVLMGRSRLARQRMACNSICKCGGAAHACLPAWAAANPEPPTAPACCPSIHPSLQALQFRLREDLKAAGGDLAAFDQLKEASGGAVWEAVACVASRMASRKQGAPVTQTG